MVFLQSHLLFMQVCKFAIAKLSSVYYHHDIIIDAANGDNVSRLQFYQNQMRSHLADCFRSVLFHFPAILLQPNSVHLSVLS